MKDAPGTWRIPLQTGSEALISLWAGTLAGQWFCIFGIVFAARGGAGWIPASLFLFFGILFGGTGISWARRARASDLLFSREGMRVEGGVRHGLTLAWDEVDVARCEVCKTPQGLSEVWALRLWTADGERLDLAQTQEADEIASFRDVLAVLKSARPNQPGVARPAPTGAVVVHCPRCGAIAAPADAAWVPCVYCRAAVAIPADLRARVRAARELDAREHARNARLIELLRDQPTAKTLNRWFGASALFIQLCSPFALVGIGFIPLNKITLVLNHAVSSRKAFRAVGVGFRAHAPARPGEALRCRSCGSPLPAAESVVVRCAYCQAENVALLDLTGSLEFERAAARDLSAAVGDYTALDPRQARRAALLVWLSSAAAAMVLLSAAAYVVAREAGRV